MGRRKKSQPHLTSELSFLSKNLAEVYDSSKPEHPQRLNFLAKLIAKLWVWPNHILCVFTSDLQLLMVIPESNRDFWRPRKSSHIGTKFAQNHQLCPPLRRGLVWAAPKNKCTKLHPDCEFHRKSSNKITHDCDRADCPKTHFGALFLAKL